MRSLRIPTLALVAVVLLSPPAFAKKKDEAQGNTIENLFRPARISDVYISPNGKWAAGLAPINGADGNVGLVVVDLDTMKIKRSFKWIPGTDLYNHTWLDNDFISFNVGKWGAFAAGVHRMNVAKGSSDPLFADDAVVAMMDPMTDQPGEAWVWIRDVWEGKPSLALINKNGSAKQGALQDYRTYSTAQNPLVRERIPQPPGDVYWWYIDHAHEPRIVSRFFDEKLEYLHRNSRKEDWKPLPLDPEEWRIHLFSNDNRSLYVSGYKGADTKGLYLYDIEANTFSELLFSDPYYDFSDSARFLTIKAHLVGIHYQRDMPAMVWLAPELEQIQKMIDNTLKGRINVVYDWADDFSRLLIYSYSDTTPPEYVLFDLKTKQLKEISKSSPWLDNAALTKTEVFHFQTSDGLRIEGYLNRPTTGQAPYPTVALIHGGPWVRDEGGFDPEVQFLNSRGYAVMKVNYRGSTGYGKKISEDPEYDFLAMQRDITEAVQHMVKKGVADPERLAIMGASFGGYSALCGAAFEPDLYRCAITNMGVFDWEEMTKDRKRQRSRYSHQKLVAAFGDPKSIDSKFAEISPINHVEKIKIPIFVIHGKNDRNVSIRQSKDLVAELKKANVVHQTHFVGGEGHNYFSMKNSIETYTRIAEFLDAHMQ